MTQRKRDNKEGQGTGLKDREDHKIQPPKKYKVIMHNDDYTPMNFVVAVLIQVFHKSETAAHNIMMSVHESGRGVAGIYPKSIAEMKVAKCMSYSQQYRHPFLVDLESE